MTAAIDRFLNCTARWTPRWFNKPKFHILLHLPAHIRRFGPAILFATEAFESFNAVIRSKSILSNRLAPSRDIARAFTTENRIRHLLSGGIFLAPVESIGGPPKVSDVAVYVGGDGLITAKVPPRILRKDDLKGLRVLRVVGPGPQALVATKNVVTHYLGLDAKDVMIGKWGILEPEMQRLIPCLDRELQIG